MHSISVCFFVVFQFSTEEAARETVKELDGKRFAEVKHSRLTAQLGMPYVYQAFPAKNRVAPTSSNQPKKNQINPPLRMSIIHFAFPKLLKKNSFHHS
jgi:hypothetical protein